MVCDEVVDVAEKRHLVSPDYPNYTVKETEQYFLIHKIIQK